MALLFPDQYVQSVYEIDFDQLKDANIDTLLFDVDNTLEVYTTPFPGEKVQALFEELKDKGFSVRLVSNGKEPKVRLYASMLKIGYYFRAGKPSPKYFKLAMKELHTEPARTAVIGDQIFTDVLGGNLSGCYSILTEPISRSIDETITAVKRPLEKVVMFFFKICRK